MHKKLMMFLLISCTFLNGMENVIGRAKKLVCFGSPNSTFKEKHVQKGFRVEYDNGQCNVYSGSGAFAAFFCDNLAEVVMMPESEGVNEGNIVHNGKGVCIVYRQKNNGIYMRTVWDPKECIYLLTIDRVDGTENEEIKTDGKLVSVTNADGGTYYFDPRAVLYRLRNPVKRKPKV